MKSLVFNPLRRIAKTKRVVVAAYAQWQRIASSDYEQFRLTIDETYRSLGADEYVFNHAGEQLFWRDFEPASIAVFNHSIMLSLEEIRAQHLNYGIRWTFDSRVHYIARGLDCEGTPTFSHYTADMVTSQFENMNEFEPLTVGVVVKWFGWWLYQLQNADLQPSKP